MADISKRRGKYRVRWYDHQGERRSRTFKRERDAVNYGRKMDLKREAILAGTAPAPVRRHTFQELADYHEEHVFPDLRSVATYRSALKVHLLPTFGGMALVEITEQVIDTFSARLIGLSDKSRKNILAILRRMLNKARRLGWLHSVPHITMPRVTEGELNYLATTAEFQARIDAAREERPGIAELYATALYAGPRAGELAGLRRFDVDLPRRRIRVARTYDGDPTKSGKIRWVPILDALRPILDRWMKESQNPVLFPNRDGGALGRGARAFDEIYHRCLERAGLPYFRFHDLRHSFAAAWVSNGGSLYKLQQILGHASPTTTQRYAHLAPDAYREDWGRIPAFGGVSGCPTRVTTSGGKPTPKRASASVSN